MREADLFASDFKKLPFWWEDAPPTEEEGSQPLPTAVEVLVIGGGYAGLSAATGAEATIVHLTLEIEKLRLALYGQRSERKARLLEQLELQLEELEASATEDELAAARTSGSAERGALPLRHGG